MNIRSAIRLTLIHPIDIWLVIRLTPVYTNEYYVGNLPDPLIHPMNIPLAICLSPVYTNEYSVGNSPDPYIRQTNIRSVIPLLIHHCIWSLCHAVRLSDSIGYPISNVGNAYNGLSTHRTHYIHVLNTLPPTSIIHILYIFRRTSTGTS